MHQKTIKELSELLQQKKISSVELTQLYLDRIAQFNPALNACVATADNALDQAQRIDELRAGSERESLSVLAGIPIIHKDNMCTKGLPTTCCSKALKDFIPPYDATLVSNLQHAGMITVAKANMDEFAMGGSNENSYFGACFNPWNKARVPGGSSGGSASSVAARLAPCATGSDTGGSIRQPAAYCGITGMKPSYGLVSRHGMVAFASSLDQAGPMAQTAEDCAMLLSHMASYDPDNDMTSVDQGAQDYTANLHKSVKSLRIGLPKEYFTDDLPKEMQQRMDECIKMFQTMGCEILEVSIPDVKHVVSAYYTIAPCEASSNLARFDGNVYGHRSQQQHSDIDSFYIQNRSEAFGREVKRRIMVGTYALSSGYYNDYYVKAQNIRNLIRHDFHEAFRQVDVILAPTTSSFAFNVGELINDPVRMYQQDLFTIPVNLAELPSLAFPIGFMQAMPIGMQAIGPRWSEMRLLNLVNQYQKITDWHARIPSGYGESEE